ncbi:MAG: glycosyltransferase family protein [Myxococcota bacterium]
MALLHYYVHGRGRGHASRSRVIIAALQSAGHEVIAFAGRDAEALLRDQTTTYGVESVVPSMGARGPLLVTRRVREALTAIRRDGAELVLSDGDLPGLLAATASRRPSIAVGHGLVFYCCERPPDVPAGPWHRESRKAAVSTVGANRRVAVNFVPLRTKRGRLARPALELGTATRRTSDGPLLCYFRDGAPDALLRRLAALPMDVVLFAATPPTVPGIHHEMPSRSRFIEVQRQARAVVATAGSQLMSECVALGVPLLAAHAPDDDEQALNVAMLRRAGLGDGCPLPQLDDARLEAFFARPTPEPMQWDAPDVATVVGEEVDALLGGAR